MDLPIASDLIVMFAQELNLVIRVAGEVESIGKELRLVQLSMELVEGLEHPGEDEASWAHEAGMTFHEIENVVDIFQSKRSRYLRRGALKKTLLLLPLVLDRVKLRRKVRKIRAQIQDVYSRRPTQLSSHPQALLASSSSVVEQTAYHAASTAVSLALSKINIVLSQKLLFNPEVREIRSEFERLHGSILGDLEGGTYVDERARVWTDQIIIISRFTEKTFLSFINKREPQLRRQRFSFPKKPCLALEDYSFGKTIENIKLRVLSLYKRKWIFGIGDMKTISTAIVSVESRPSSYYSPISSRFTHKTFFLFSDPFLVPDLILRRAWVIILDMFLLEAARNAKELEWIKGDLNLMEALFKDVDGIDENHVDKRVVVWLDQMRKISEEPATKDLRDEQKTKTLRTKRIIAVMRQINMKLSEMSERKWTYDIGKIDGRRYTSLDRRRLNSLSWATTRRTILSERPIESLQDEVELMDAVIEDAQSLEEGPDAMLEVWLEQMQDIAADAKELLQNTDRIRRGFFDSRIRREIDLIHRRIHWMSRRKWLYDIRIRGRRVGRSSKNASGSGSGRNSQMLVRPVFTFYDFEWMIWKMLNPRLGESVRNLVPNVESIRRESNLLHALLEDVERSDRRVKAWLSQVTDVADKIDVAITDYYEHTKSNWRMQIIHRARIAEKIELIKDKTRDVMERRMTFGIELNQKKKTFTKSVAYTLDKRKTIGKSFDVLQAVTEQLLMENEQCIVVSVIGMNGIGKTTLAKLIYSSDIVASHFPSHVWVSLPSDGYTDESLERTVEEPLLRLLKLEKGDVIEADHSKHVLVVLDEVRTTEIWDIVIKKLRSILYDRKIILLITTSDVAVAVHADPKSTPYRLQLFNDDDSWALFAQSLIVPEKLIERSKKMVMKCGGLPWMIMELREQFSRLSSNTEEWTKALDTQNLDQGPWRTTQEVIKGLPLRLKRCLLHLNQFPADFEIPLRRLTLLWLAEGSLHQWWDDEGLESPESVTEKYMTELADRCVVQVTKRNLHGEVMKCRLPRGVRELLSSESENGESKDLKSSSGSNKIRYLIHYEKEEEATPSPFQSFSITDLSASALSEYQSVIAFRSFDSREGNQPGEDLGEFLDRCISSRTFLLMRVLDLECVFKPVLSKALGALVLLKYLGLRWTYLESLPSCMSQLLNLQTLDVKHTSISILPNSIWKMGQLRYLFLDEYYHCRFVPRPSRYSLPHLQTLWNVFIDEDSPVNGGLDSLINLKRLGVECRLMSYREDAMLSQLETVAKWVQTLKDLKSLRLKSFDKCGQPWNIPLKTLSSQKSLCNLYLLGRVERDLVIFGLPSTLTDLTLSGSGLEDDPMQILKELSNLRSLRLFSDSFVGKKMLCSEGFAQLRILKIWKLENLEEWKVESGALPTLGDLEIRCCKRLKMSPDALQNLKTLQRLDFPDMPKEWDEIKKKFFASNEENITDEYGVAHAHVSIGSPIEEKREHQKNGNTSTSLSAGGFVQLRMLKLGKVDKLQTWKAENGVFLSLTDIEIRRRKGNNENSGKKYEGVHTPVSVLSPIKEKIERLKVRSSHKRFLTKIFSEELQINPWECPFCGVEKESLIHIFFLCKPIKMIWFDNWGLITDKFSNLSISEWINHILTPSSLFGDFLPNQTDFIRFSVTFMETIWSWRNKIVNGAAELLDPDMIHKDVISSLRSSLYMGE